MIVFDYFTALYDRFAIHSMRVVKRQQAVEEAAAELREHLSLDDRKLLLRLIDEESDLQDEVELEAFISGFRLAFGITRELAELPSFSIEREDEDRGKMAFEREAEG